MRLPVWSRLCGLLIVFALCGFHTPAAHGDDSPVVKLLKSGRVPEARQGAVVEMIGKRGSVDDLTYLYEQAWRPRDSRRP